jgi:hypothetical protein
MNKNLIDVQFIIFILKQEMYTEGMDTIRKSFKLISFESLPLRVGRRKLIF